MPNLTDFILQAFKVVDRQGRLSLRLPPGTHYAVYRAADGRLLIRCSPTGGPALICRQCAGLGGPCRWCLGHGYTFPDGSPDRAQLPPSSPAATYPSSWDRKVAADAQVQAFRASGRPIPTPADALPGESPADLLTRLLGTTGTCPCGGDDTCQLCDGGTGYPSQFPITPADPGPANPAGPEPEPACQECFGAGHPPGSKATCPSCQGSGRAADALERGPYAPGGSQNPGAPALG